MSTTTCREDLQSAARCVHLRVQDMTPVEGYPNILRLEFQSNPKLMTDDARKVVRVYNETKSSEVRQRAQERGLQIEFDQHLEFLVLYGPLTPQPNKMFVAIVLPDPPDLADERPTSPKQVRGSHEVTTDEKTARSPFESNTTVVFPEKSKRSQKTGIAMGEEVLAAKEGQINVDKSHSSGVGAIVEVYPGRCLLPKAVGMAVAVIRHNVTKLVMGAEEHVGAITGTSSALQN